ncbi:MAG: hypothetical protein WCG96_11475 [Actinomycetes bacterium]
MESITSRARRPLRRVSAGLCIGLAASLSVLSVPASAVDLAPVAPAQSSATAATAASGSGLSA